MRKSKIQIAIQSEITKRPIETLVVAHLGRSVGVCWFSTSYCYVPRKSGRPSQFMMFTIVSSTATKKTASSKGQACMATEQDAVQFSHT